VDTDLNPATSDFAKMLIPQMTLPRCETVDEIAALVAYLASPAAAYVTGASLAIDVGFTAQPTLRPRQRRAVCFWE
jgi:3-oxoacyl-[acyl-carrier protein] reductase